MRQHFFSVATLAFSLLRNVPEESHHDRTTNRLQEVSALLVKLFEIDPQDIKPKRACTKIWNWTASTPLT